MIATLSVCDAVAQEPRSFAVRSALTQPTRLLMP
jgi:hypothetical protein